MEITLFKSHELDRSGWDEFILSSPQGFIYGLSDYLDIVSPGWEALICQKGDVWLAVMPWFPKKKFGIKYVFQPAFCQFQGIYFSPLANEVSHQRSIGLLYSEMIRRSCHVFQSNFSGKISYPFPFIWQGFSVQPMLNYTLAIQPGMDVRETVSHGHRKKIKKAERENLTFRISDSISDTIQLFVQNKGEALSFLTGKNYEQVKRIYEIFSQREMAFVAECLSPEGQLLASLLLVRYKNTMIQLFGTVSEVGKKSGAMVYTIFNALEFSTQKGCTLYDFEGSMIQPIEIFFREFGAEPQVYWQIRRTPFTKLLRKIS